MPHCTPETSVSDMAELLRQPASPWPDGWAGWKNTQQAHIKILEETIRTCPPYPEGKYRGRGIVISVNAKPGWSSGKNLPNGYFPGAWVVVNELRRLGCTLPIVFAYIGDLELDPKLVKLVEPLGVECMDLQRLTESDPMRILGGWESKVYALYHAPFEQVIYMDADCFPVRSPELLFDSPQFKHTGAIFWPDLPPYDRPEWLPAIVWENIGVPPNPDYVDFESGQLAIDKRKCWKEFVAARHINEHSDWYYKFVFGDKSTFHLAWAKCQDMGINRGWAIPKTPAGWNGKHIEQHDFGGQVLFQHATQDKPSLTGFAHPHHLIHREHCERHLEDLRRRWDGRLWANDDPSPEEMVWVRELMTRTWEYERVGLGKRNLRFVSDGRVGLGLGKCEVSWAVFDSKQGPKLMISDVEGKPTFSAIRNDRGEWHGRWFEHERCPVVLRPTSVPVPPHLLFGAMPPVAGVAS